MKNIFKLTIIAVAIILSGTVFAQEGKKVSSGKAKQEHTKKNNKTTSKPASSKAKGSGAASNSTNPGGIAISENGVPTVKTATVSTTPNAPH